MGSLNPLFGKKQTVWKTTIYQKSTLPETNITPENDPLEVWRFLLETIIFRFYVSFRDGNTYTPKQPRLKPEIHFPRPIILGIYVSFRGCAIQFLSKCWLPGENFEQWFEAK